MTQYIWQFPDFAFRSATGAAALCVALLLTGVVGCGGDDRATADSVVDGEHKEVESLVDGLEAESEAVRRQAQLNLEKVLNRKIYFDPAAPLADRNRALEDVRAMWKNIKDRDLLADIKKRVPLQYYYDLNTSDLFEAQAGPGPIETQSGTYKGMPAGVRAVVFSCNDCARDRYVGWVQAPITELEKSGIAYDSAGFEPDGDTILFWAIRSPEGGPWTLLGSPAAEAINSAARNCDDRPTPLFCRPGR